MRRLIKVSLLTLVLVALGFLCLISATVYTYSTLTDETLIAEVEFEQIGAQEYLAHLRTGCDERLLRVYGDQWRIDAEFLKWKYWASLLGLDSQFRLDRFEGRYRGAVEQNTRQTLSHDLNEPHVVNLVGLADALGPFNMLVDATYGSSTYRDIDTSTVHLVYKTPTGLLTRSVPRGRAETDAQGLAINIRRACGDGPGYLQRMTQWADAALVNALGWAEG